jgi:hypothetical protein
LAEQREAQEVTVVKGKAPNKPPLTYEAQNAIRMISSELWKLTSEIEKLSEPALKGFAYEARRHAATIIGSCGLRLRSTLTVNARY